jgi:NTP pyrophosphatase (non-canonical NTP hydrolase)
MEKRSINDYIGLACVTEAPVKPVLQRLADNPDLLPLFYEDMKKTIAVLQNLDKWKKTLYYGKEYPGFKIKKTWWDKVKSFFKKKEPLLELKDDQAGKFMVRMLHGSVGIATESCELMEAIQKYLSGKQPFDAVNAKEELADVGWYQNVLFDLLQTNANESFELWYQKLEKRYGSKFDAYRANNRDLVGERKLLEDQTEADKESTK